MYKFSLSECPEGKLCFPVQECNEPGNRFCGKSAFLAATCEEGSECVSTLDCPFGEECYPVSCRGDGNFFCGYSQYGASKCIGGTECSSDADCQGSQTCREVKECWRPPTSSPTNMPTPKPRKNIAVDYLLCLEHGLLTSTKKLTMRTTEDIKTILDNRFKDKVADVDERWNVDETHLRVEEVTSKYLKDSPANFECEFIV